MAKILPVLVPCTLRTWKTCGAVAAVGRQLGGSPPLGLTPGVPVPAAGGGSPPTLP